ncbi:related to acetylcholinesterase precursor [Rhynchosporium agropyri]|uniref:Carboxylic ester hydrolase n=1 Tax=Rhynchosporium agropyri TaxID=914238 RepID=A0A1E1KA58_9HELO|nr:related to acetylcholinesterase precursor [Rhynchosporium agropyri]
MTFSTKVLGIALSAASIAQAAGSWTVGQVVSTSSGSVKGHAAPVAVEVSEYLGIPFAQPPVGELRWTAPKAYEGTGDINGTNFGFSCPAGLQMPISAANLKNANTTASGFQILAALGQVGDKFSEDCLTVNVWTQPQTGSPKKAVLVWIYGGGFTTGNSDNPAYNGQYIASSEDVVVVSFNYRLNIFGFPGTPNGTQNLGLLDQRLAMEWVRDNIEKFGGDKEKITLFGQSAGSASVDYHMFAWKDNPIAHGFIQLSGSALGPAGGLGPIAANKAAEYWNAAATALGCGNSSSTSDQATVLSCMKGKSYTDVLKAVAAGTSGVTGVSYSFSPTVDDVVVYSNYTSLSLAGKFAKQPLLLGVADYEAGLFRVLDAFRNQTKSDEYYDAFNSIAFVCPCAQRAAYSIANNVPTWRYRWFGAFPNTQLTTVPYSAAWHASELPVLFNTTPATPANTEAEIAIGAYLRGAWAAFAKDPKAGLTSYEGGWPMYKPGEETLVRLAYNNMTGTNLARGTMYDGACKTFYGAGNGTSSSGNATMSGGSGSSTSTGSGSDSSTPKTVTTSGAGSMKTWISDLSVLVGAVVMAAFL